MITIRSEQAAMLRKAALPLAIGAHLRTVRPAAFEAYPAPHSHELIELGITIAARYAIDDDADIAFFVTLMCEVCPLFFAHAAVAAILDDLDTPAGIRLAQLATRFSDTDWSHIAADLRWEHDPARQASAALSMLRQAASG